MKPHQSTAILKDSMTPKSLNLVLDQSEHIEDLVVEAAEDLSSVNTELKRVTTARNPQPEIERAIEKNEAAEEKVADASEKLAVVNQALEAEIKERHELEDQLDAITEQGEAHRHTAMHDVLTGLPEPRTVQ